MLQTNTMPFLQLCIHAYKEAITQYYTNCQKKEVAAPLNDTLVGLQEVGDLLQASLKEIEHERVIANDSNESATSFTSNTNLENSISTAILDRNNSQNLRTRIKTFDDNNYKNDASYSNRPM